MRTVESAPEVIDIARPHLALALDVGDLSAALELWRRFGRYFAIAKVGLELFSAVGPAAVSALSDEGASVFVDLKLHDIPTTVSRAAGRLAALGASFVTAHTAGGEAMLAAAVEGFAASSGGRGADSSAPSGVLGVTVLTSELDAPAELLARRAALAERSGCVGVVCAAADLPIVRREVPQLRAVVPGVRLAGSAAHDQVRVSSPGSAIAQGASVLVIGRAVTGSPEGEAAARQVAAEVAEALVELPA